MPGDLGEVLDVGLGAGGDVVEHDLLGRAAAERDLDLGQQVAHLEVEAVGVGGREGHAEGLAAGDDRDLAHRIGARGEHADDRVAGLVVGGAAAIVLGEHHLALGAEHDPLERVA